VPGRSRHPLLDGAARVVGRYAGPGAPGQGPFRDISFAVAPQSLARGLGTIALGLVNPLLALLPLVETGPGEAANCRAGLEPVKGAVQHSGKSVEQAPTKGERRTRDPTAPIVNVPPEMAADDRPTAPIVDVPTRN
jgi:hypothetical protein